MFLKSISDQTDICHAHYFCPKTTASNDLLEAAGQRWKVEECCQRAKGEVGLAEHEVRNWQGWHRHIVLAMWALAILVLSQRQVKKTFSGELDGHLIVSLSVLEKRLLVAYLNLSPDHPS